MLIWIIAGIMGAVFVVLLLALIIGVTRRRGYALQSGARPEKRRQYDSRYHLDKGGHIRVKRINLRTGRLQRGARPKKRPQIVLD